MVRVVAFASILTALTIIGEGIAQPIRPTLAGNAALSNGELLSTLRDNGLLSFRPGIAERIGDALLERYHEHGFYFTRIDSLSIEASRDSTFYSLFVELTEGTPVTLGECSVTGNSAIETVKLFDAMELKRGTTFSQASLSAGIASIIALYERQGYPFASVTVDDLNLTDTEDGPAMNVALRIDEGRLFTVDEFTIEGNTLTQPRVITRETRIAIGEVFHAEKVASIRRRLERLGFFSGVSEPDLYVRGDRGGLLIRVVEGQTNVFDGVIGWQPERLGVESGYLTGLVKLSFRNVFGTGRRFDARWERATREVSEIEIRYLEPWLFGQPLNLGGGFFQRQQDSAYVQRMFDAKATVLATSSLSLSALVQLTEVIRSQNSIIASLSSSKTLSGGLELLIDTRDDVYNPRSGLMLRNGYSFGTKRTTLSGAVQSEILQKLEVDASYYHEFFPRHVAALALHGRELRGNAADQTDFYRLGGANTLRGYREEQFSGTRIAWLNCEYRYSLGRRSFAFAFFDLGYIFLPANEAASRAEFTAVQHGFGIGGRLETGLGVIGVSYALGEGDSLTNGKVHFGLINEF